MNTTSRYASLQVRIKAAELMIQAALLNETLEVEIAKQFFTHVCKTEGEKICQRNNFNSPCFIQWVLKKDVVTYSPDNNYCQKLIKLYPTIFDDGSLAFERTLKENIIAIMSKAFNDAANDATHLFNEITKLYHTTDEEVSRPIANITGYYELVREVHANCILLKSLV